MLHLDFETTTGDSVFFDPKMFVVSYCQIYSFHPSLELDKIVFLKFSTDKKYMKQVISNKNALPFLTRQLSIR